MNKFLSSFVVLMLAINSFAAEMGVPVQLKFAKPDGSYPTDNNASFVVQILSPAGGCIVYEEDFNAQNVVSGSISLSVTREEEIVIGFSDTAVTRPCASVVKVAAVDEVP